jgi:hypothetical protein
VDDCSGLDGKQHPGKSKIIKKRVTWQLLKITQKSYPNSEAGVLTPSLNKAILSESFGQKALPETVRYVFESMMAIDPAYTTKTYAEAERVKNQIQKNLALGVDVDFEHQGSVPLNTHIKIHSDLDILAIITQFETLEHPQEPAVRYLGDPVADLRNLRGNIYTTLSGKFPEAEVDNTKPKAVSICKGSLLRRFDVIIGNWYNTNDYARSSDKKDRGIYIYDKGEGNRFADYPFSHMAAVDVKANRIFNDNFRRLIRFLKSLKMDAEPMVELSSFMITSAIYHMADGDLSVNNNNSTRLLVNVSKHLTMLIDNPIYRRALLSPNGRELLFAADEAGKVAQFRRLKTELDETIADLAEELDSNSGFFHIPYLSAIA